MVLQTTSRGGWNFSSKTQKPNWQKKHKFQINEFWLKILTKYFNKMPTKMSKFTNRQFRKSTAYHNFSFRQIGVTCRQLFLSIGLLLMQINKKSMMSKSLQGFSRFWVIFLSFKRSQVVMPCGPYSKDLYIFMKLLLKNMPVWATQHRNQEGGNGQKLIL